MLFLPDPLCPCFPGSCGSWEVSQVSRRALTLTTSPRGTQLHPTTGINWPTGINWVRRSVLPSGTVRGSQPVPAPGLVLKFPGSHGRCWCSKARSWCSAETQGEKGEVSQSHVLLRASRQPRSSLVPQALPLCFSVFAAICAWGAVFVLHPMGPARLQLGCASSHKGCERLLHLLPLP